MVTFHYTFVRWCTKPAQLSPAPREGYRRAEVKVREDHQHHKAGDVVIVDLPDRGA